MMHHKTHFDNKTFGSLEDTLWTKTDDDDKDGHFYSPWFQCAEGDYKQKKDRKSLGKTQKSFRAQ